MQVFMLIVRFFIDFLFVKTHKMYANKKYKLFKKKKMNDIFNFSMSQSIHLPGLSQMLCN